MHTVPCCSVCRAARSIPPTNVHALTQCHFCRNLAACQRVEEPGCLYLVQHGDGGPLRPEAWRVTIGKSRVEAALTFARIMWGTVLPKGGVTVHVAICTAENMHPNGAPRAVFPLHLSNPSETPTNG